MSSRFIIAFAIAVLIVSFPVTAQAQDEAEEDYGWSFLGELTFVSTSGNAESETIGLGLEAVRTRELDELSFAAGGLRAESTTTTRFAEGTPDDFRVIESSTDALTAENVYLRGRYQRDLNDKLYWYAGAGWERNEFAGFDSRLSGVGGIGRQWWSDDRGKFRTDVGVTFTSQDNLVGGTDDFLGLRLAYDYLRKLTETTTFTSGLIIDQNLDDSDDLRADFLNAISVSINELMSLKAGFHLLFDNMPSLVEVPLFSPAGEALGTAFAELDDIDTQLSLALVFTR